MFWVLVFGGIALAGLVMLICYAVWLAHKAADVMSELSMLGQRGAELGELVAQIQVPQPDSAHTAPIRDEVDGEPTGQSGPFDRSAT